MEVLLLSTLAVGALHALAPDHWLPFVMLGRAQHWNRRRLTGVTVLAGLGHVASSLVIGMVGIVLGAAAQEVGLWEGQRGNVASLLLIGFGLAYMVWGIKNWGRKHSHHGREKVVTSWTLFALIVFGPCEPLIPLMFVGFGFGWAFVAAVFVVFAVATIAVMLAQVHMAIAGLSLAKVHWLEEGSAAIAGGVIALTGVAIRVLGI